MKYLSYRHSGFLKKFPLKNQFTTLGRSSENDLTIEDCYLSRVHLRIEIIDEGIVITDQDTANGTFFQSQRINQAIIHTGETFTAGRTEIGLREGSVDEFDITRHYIPVSHPTPPLTISVPEKQKRTAITKSSCNACQQLLQDILSFGYKKGNFSDFISFLTQRFTEMDHLGTLFFAWKPNMEPNILLSVQNLPDALELFKMVWQKNPDLFQQTPGFKTLETNHKTCICFYTFPFILHEKEAVLVYFPLPEQKDKDAQIEYFLSTLSKEIELIAYIYREKEKEQVRTPGKTDRVQRGKMENTGDETGAGVYPENIAVVNQQMKQLIEQAKRIAGSDIFVLIQGESGTGKELFARMLHKYSSRHKNHFIALNCAAIPGNLLESELFGHEKGAFTSAYTQRKGKLELASGGTLLLDEIGDMPLNLQAKLLRALQEKEFYRLGGSTPIKVDLRIISLTHQDLKQLIKEKKFREDLYFRLVHRTLYIPPLRERREDIPLLINYFTHRFCRQCNKTIMGFSIKAFDAMVRYGWRGNVRELENEINSLVNLSEKDEIIDFDMLSEEIRETERWETGEEIPTRLLIHPPHPGHDLHADFHHKPDKDIILRYLELYNWNKTQTAKALNMTYQGLHKKMLRLGILEKENHERQSKENNHQ